MNQMKTHLAALSLLDRALSAMTDEEVASLVETLPEGHVDTLDSLAGAPSGGFTDPSARVMAVRTAAARGRMNGTLEQIATILTDPCLARCITDLGDAADNPTEEQFLEVAPGLVEEYGMPAVRLMMATSVAGEASASAMLVRLLKGDGDHGLPPLAPREVVTLAPPKADDETRARRKAAKAAKQEAHRASREQAARARGRA